MDNTADLVKVSYGTGTPIKGVPFAAVRACHRNGHGNDIGLWAFVTDTEELLNVDQDDIIYATDADELIKILRERNPAPDGCTRAISSNSGVSTLGSHIAVHLLKNYIIEPGISKEQLVEVVQRLGTVACPNLDARSYCYIDNYGYNIHIVNKDIYYDEREGVFVYDPRKVSIVTAARNRKQRRNSEPCDRNALLVDTLIGMYYNVSRILMRNIARKLRHSNIVGIRDISKYTGKKRVTNALMASFELVRCMGLMAKLREDTCYVTWLRSAANGLPRFCGKKPYDEYVNLARYIVSECGVLKIKIDPLTMQKINKVIKPDS